MSARRTPQLLAKERVRGKPRVRNAATKQEPAHVSRLLQVPDGRRRPRQQRAQDTVDAILQAAGEVIADRGWAGTTTNHIAERAGVSIGSLYQYFPNKDSILVALMERHLRQVQPIVQEAIDAMDDESVPVARSLETLFDRLVEMHEREPRLSRVLAEQVPLPPVVEKMHAAGDLSIARRIAASLERRRDTRSDDALAMAHVLAQATEALSRWIVHHAPASLDKQAYMRQAVRMLADFVAAEPRRPVA